MGPACRWPRSRGGMEQPGLCRGQLGTRHRWGLLLLTNNDFTFLTARPQSQQCEQRRD